MPFVRTVTGDVNPTEIGRTSMHEHIFIDARVWFQEPATVPSVGPLDPDTPVGPDVLWALRRSPVILRDNLVIEDEELAVEELQYFKDAGGDCIVDVTSIGLSPNPAGLRRVAQRTGLHIVAGTSFYVEPAHPPYVQKKSVEELADQIAQAVTTGIEGSDVRAGIIGEIGTTSVSPAEEKVLRASAQAHHATGAAITIHTQPGYNAGERVIQILTSEGVKPERIALGHMDESLIDSSTFAPNLAYLDYHRRCLDLGVYVQYDTFGTEWYWDNWNMREPRDADRIAALATLIKEGWEDKLLLAEDVWVKQCLRHYGGWGYDFLVRIVPVMLRQAGVSDETIDKLLIQNPRKVLTFDAV